MDRRTVIKGLAAAGGVAATTRLSAPALAQNAKVLKFVPQSNLSNFDPIWGTQYVVRNASNLVWDTLYGTDANLKIQRQMVEIEEISADGLTYTFKLRPGLKFHDGAPVLARDCVASIDRWSQRDAMGKVIRTIQEELSVVDDKTFKWVLSKPFPKLIEGLAKIATPCCFIMPERMAKTSPFKQITEYVGSGPMKFVTSDFRPGALAAFEKFDGYVPRSEPASWLTGGKVVHFDRVEWLIMSDPATASAALQSGEVDWWETPLPDLVPLLKRNPNIKVDIGDPFGHVGAFRFNYLYPPFNNVKIRQAIQAATSQQDYMQAIVGTEDALWKPMASFFTPGSPYYNEEGAERLKANSDYTLAKKLLEEGGYDGSPVTCLVAQDQAPMKAMGEITADMLKKIGMNIDFVATDWGTVGKRRASRNKPGEGGWNMFHTWMAGVTTLSPIGNSAINANKSGWGWPDIPEMGPALQSWYDAKSEAEGIATAKTINKIGMDNAVYVPTGFWLGYQAWRSNVTGITQGPCPWFWGPKKA